MSDREFESGGKKFKLLKVDAFAQFHIVRRMGPMLAELLPAIKSIKDSAESKLSEEEKFDNLAKVLGPFMVGLSKMSEADANKVLYGLLSSVEVQQETGNWARVSTDSMLMIQNIELPTMMEISGRAFMFNLSGFFSGPQRN